MSEIKKITYVGKIIGDLKNDTETIQNDLTSLETDFGQTKAEVDALTIPKSLKGFGITMVTASFMAMAFYVFALVA